ncbi:hypothetical protein HRD57_07205 [Tetragenococcus halophilus]|nr:hypothetical protein [Tetragenococcus halophilus]
MNALLGTLFLFGIVGTWYFAEKRPNKQYRNISLGITLLIAALIWFIPSSYFFFVNENNVSQQSIEKNIKGNFEGDGLS